MTQQAAAVLERPETEQENAEQHDNHDKEFTAENIPGGVLKFLQAHTAAEKGRYALNHVHVEGRELAAADGASLAIVNLPDELGEETLYRMPKPKFGKNKPVTLTRKNGQMRAEQSDGNSAKLEVYKAAPDNMRFPNYREVIPSGKQGTVFMADIKRLQNALELLACAGHNTAKIAVKRGDCPFRIDGYGQSASGISPTVVISPIVEDLKK